MTIKGQDLNTDLISFKPPKTHDSGAKLVYVNYEGKMFTIQTPMMDMPFDMSEFKPENGGVKYSITLSFNGMEDKPKLKAFHDKLCLLEEKIVEGGIENSLPWLRKPSLSKEVVQNMFTPILRVSMDKETGLPDGKYAPTMRVKVPCYDNKFVCELTNKVDGTKFDVNGEDDIHSVLVRGSKAKCILQCVGLWMSDKGYSCSWKLVKAQMEVSENAQNSNFIDSDDEDEDTATTTTNESTNFVESDDDEEVVVEEPKKAKAKAKGKGKSKSKGK
jgi:hypothetical protein